MKIALFVLLLFSSLISCKKDSPGTIRNGPPAEYRGPSKEAGDTIYTLWLEPNVGFEADSFGNYFNPILFLMDNSRSYYFTSSSGSPYGIKFLPPHANPYLISLYAGPVDVNKFLWDTEDRCYVYAVDSAMWGKPAFEIFEHTQVPDARLYFSSKTKIKTGYNPYFRDSLAVARKLNTYIMRMTGERKYFSYW